MAGRAERKRARRCFSAEGCVDFLPHQAHHLHRVSDDHAARGFQWTSK